MFYYEVMYFISFEGFPYHIVFSGTFLFKKLPAPITAFLPIFIPPMKVEPAPIETPSSIFVTRNSTGYFFVLGYLSLIKVTFGPIKTLFPILSPSHKYTPLLTVTLSPIMTSFSIKQWQLILQFFPIITFSKTTTYCHMIVPSPMFLLFTSESLCINLFPSFKLFKCIVISDIICS